ncbi:MAG: hypothetical protein H7831_00675 [Magnetococcus sp. WYHC-3]
MNTPLANAESSVRVPRNGLLSSFLFPLLLISLPSGTLALGQVAGANIQYWEVLTIAMLASILVKTWMGQGGFILNREAMLLGSLFLLVAYTSALGALSASLWFKQSLLLTAMMLVFWLTAHRFDRSHMEYIPRLIIYPGLLVALWGVAEIVLNPGKLSTFSMGLVALPRAQSVFNEPNELSQYLSLPFAFTYASLIYNRKIRVWEKGVFLLVLFVLIFTQILTFSRGGILAFFGVLLAWSVLVLLIDISRIYFNMLRFGLVLILLIGAIVGLARWYPDIGDILQGLTVRLEYLLKGGSADATVSTRLVTMYHALERVEKSTWAALFGMGFGNLPVVLGENIANTGNMLTDILAETGMMGLAVFCVIIFTYMIKPFTVMREYYRQRDSAMLAMSMGAYLAMVGMIAGGQTSPTHMLVMFWFNLGLLAALSQYSHVMATEGGTLR